MRKNNKVISALLIGISSMMALSTPMTAYASDDANTNLTSNENQNEQQESTLEEKVETEATETDSALENAEGVIDTSTDLILEGGEYTPNEEDTETQTITPANEEDGSPASQSAIVDFIDATKEVANDTNLQEAETLTEGIETEIKTVETNEAKADQDAETIINNSEAIDEQITLALKDEKDAVDTVNELATKAAAAETPEETQEYCNQIQTKIDSAEGTFETRKEYVDQLATAYELAVQELNDLEGKIDTSLNKMDTDSDTAQDKIEAAQGKVTVLKEALATAQSKLNDGSTAAENIEQAMEKAQEADNDNDWANLRPVMRSVIENYIVSNETNGEAKDIQIHDKVAGFDKQDYNYYKVTYTVNDEEKVKYFNMDRLDKLYNSSSIYTNLGNDKNLGFVVYEKESIEIAANQYLYEYYQAKYEQDIANGGNEEDWKWYTQGILKNKGYTNVYQSMANAGTFNVFTDGTNLLTKEEIDKKLNDGEIEVADAGYRYIEGGQEISRIIQNNNSLIHSGNCQVVALQEQIDKYIDPEKKEKNYVSDALIAYYGDEEKANEVLQSVTDKAIALNDFIDSADSYSEQYKQYSAIVQDIDNAVQKAEDEVKELNEAIDNLKEARGNRIIKSVKNMSNFANLLGMTIDEVSEMSQQDIITALDNKLKDAKDTLNDIQETLDGLKEVKQNIQDKIDEDKKPIVVDDDDNKDNDEPITPPQNNDNEDDNKPIIPQNNDNNNNNNDKPIIPQNNDNKDESTVPQDNNNKEESIIPSQNNNENNTNDDSVNPIINNNEEENNSNPSIINDTTEENNSNFIPIETREETPNLISTSIETREEQINSTPTSIEIREEQINSTLEPTVEENNSIPVTNETVNDTPIIPKVVTEEQITILPIMKEETITSIINNIDIIETIQEYDNDDNDDDITYEVVQQIVASSNLSTEEQSQVVQDAIQQATRTIQSQDAITEQSSTTELATNETEQTPPAPIITNIDDNKVALADKAPITEIKEEKTEDKKDQPNYWWLVLIALLGATGWKLYYEWKKDKDEENE